MFRRRKAAQAEPPSLTSDQFGVDPFQDPTVTTDQQEIHPSSTCRWTQTQQVHNLEGVTPLAGQAMLNLLSCIVGIDQS